ncbi:MAG: hypothetical protein WCW87_01275 [Candidatus Paceibacterota bacterium]
MNEFDVEVKIVAPKCEVFDQTIKIEATSLEEAKKIARERALAECALTGYYRIEVR